MENWIFSFLHLWRRTKRGRDKWRPQLKLGAHQGSYSPHHVWSNPCRWCHRWSCLYTKFDLNWRYGLREQRIIFKISCSSAYSKRGDRIWGDISYCYTARSLEFCFQQNCVRVVTVSSLWNLNFNYDKNMADLPQVLIKLTSKQIASCRSIWSKSKVNIIPTLLSQHVYTYIYVYTYIHVHTRMEVQLQNT
jgi:hypothetical protein